MPLVRDVDNIRLGLAGKVSQNDHPYSWSAIINGFKPEAMRQWADPVITRYLAARSDNEFGIKGVRVTHIWCDNSEDAKRIAAASRIPHVAMSADALIGEVDAVLIPTDRGEEHVARARPFVEAGVPVFIDKPLCDNQQDLLRFRQWVAEGRAIMSCSAMRYACEFIRLRERMAELGELRLIVVTMAKSWRRYGIHALEGVYSFLEPGGWISARNTGREDANVVHLTHHSGVDVIVVVSEDLLGGFGVIHAYGTRSHLIAQFSNSFDAFKRQLAGFVAFLRTGDPPFAFDETVELIRLLIAAEQSRCDAGRVCRLADLSP